MSLLPCLTKVFLSQLLSIKNGVILILNEYFYIKKYSPYDNIDFKPYPSVLVTSSLYDSQVQYFEPAKYVPKLREYSTSNNQIFKNEYDWRLGGKVED